MAQSPDSANAEATERERYLLNWAALGQMIDEGRSFSGYENNCAFLNMDGENFATISASSGLDLMDDGRAVATCDWNFDGYLDFWVTNRTAPNVRLLMNESSQAPATAGFVALRLKGGSGINRDAIGARVEIYPEGGSKHYVRTLRAGEGFLAQSSKWLHFGLGSRTSVDRVIVRWPGAPAEPFTNVTPGGFYELVQGKGKAVLWDPPLFSLPPELAKPSQSEPAASSSTRNWILGRIPFPRSEYTDWNSERKPLHSFNGKPLAINLWSSSCKPCVMELKEWTESAERLAKAGLQVLTLSVDSMIPGQSETNAAAQELTRKLQLPFLTGNANADLVEAMEIVHRSFTALKHPLPVPCTFLLDRQGRVAAIYQGRVSSNVLLGDVAMLDKPLEEQRTNAVPFPGKWASLPFESNPMRIALTYSAAGESEKAIRYLKDILEEPEDILSGVISKSGLKQLKIDGQAMIGQLHLDAGDPMDAAEAYRALLTLAPQASTTHRSIGENLMQRNLAEPALAHLKLALSATPEDADLLFTIAMAEVASRQSSSAIGHFRKALAINPDDNATHYQLANVLLKRNDTAGAITHYREALRIIPSWPLAAHQLAWILAAHPDSSLRNGEEALTLAEAVCQRDGGGNPVTLHTWSAALAELGRFSEALRISNRAAQIAENDPAYAEFSKTIKEARRQLRQRQPIRSK
ncbi:MAG: tetratricopeptide (TPR) repeat protein [Verrucomicrobiales bacterium]